jgi:hypothetical protein
MRPPRLLLNVVFFAALSAACSSSPASDVHDASGTDAGGKDANGKADVSPIETGADAADGNTVVPDGCTPTTCASEGGPPEGVNQYFVSTTGNDENDGLSPTTAWATIGHADATLTLGPGGTACGTTSVGACVHVATGTYSASITTNTNGTAAGRIRYLSDTQYGARLVGTSGESTIWNVSGGYTDIVGFDFDGSVNSSEVQAVIVAQSAPHTHVLSNRAHDLAKAGGSTQTAAMASTSNGANASGFNVWEGNLVYHNNAGAGHPSSSGAAYTGITTGQDDIAINNIVLDIGGGWCIQATHSSTRVAVINNTLVNCDRGGLIIGNENGDVTDFSTFTNNIVVHSGAYGASSGIRIFSGGCGAKNVYANNLVYGDSPLGYEFDNGCPNTSTATQSGSDAATFVDYTGTILGDYQLKTGSTAIDAGTASCASGVVSCSPSLDFAGGSRPSGGQLDIGAFEFGSVPGAWPFH